VLYALERLEREPRRRLLEILDSRTHDQEVLKEAVALIESTGAIRDSLALAQRFRADCDDILQGLSVAPVYRDRLEALAEYVVRRAR
jgi:geranylgeranyl pyrophosphate synthase